MRNHGDRKGRGACHATADNEPFPRERRLRCRKQIKREPGRGVKAQQRFEQRHSSTALSGLKVSVKINTPDNPYRQETLEDRASAPGGLFCVNLADDHRNQRDQEQE